MANKYLLTGAGFSKSFGALLCKELTAKFFNRLSSEKEIQQHILGRENLGNFEQILSEVRNHYPDKLGIIENILKDVFIGMRLTMKKRHETPGESNFSENSAYEFLYKFDFIFTLNQDSFLKDLSNGVDKNFIAQRKLPIAKSSLYDTSYIELHGAYDWEDENDESLMIFGTSEDKVKYIESHSLFEEYFKFFSNSLNQANSKLVIIGYSFCDSHINNIIYEGINSGLEIFIWNPEILERLDGSKLDKNSLKKSLRGYLPHKFSLIGNNKDDIDRFLKS